MSFFQSYRATRGLSRFPEEKQFCVWLAAHKRLKTIDAVYRAHRRKFVTKVLLATLVFAFIVCVPTLIQHLGIIPDDSGPNANPHIVLGEMIVPWIIALIATAVFLPYVLIVSYREQAWKNEQVARQIEKESLSC
jgi:hypothetical protein